MIKLIITSRVTVQCTLWVVFVMLKLNAVWIFMLYEFFIHLLLLNSNLINSFYCMPCNWWKTNFCNWNQTIKLSCILYLQLLIFQRGFKLRRKLAQQEHKDDPLPDTLYVLEQTPQVHGIHTFIRYDNILHLISWQDA